MAMLRVSRKGYTRKSYSRKPYTRKDGTKVKGTNVGKSKVQSTTFTIKDRGAKGRGKKVFPTLKRGTLGVDFSKPASTRRRLLSKKAKMVGEKRVVGKLRAIQVLNKRTNPSVSKKALADSKYIAGSFKGKKKVRYPTGFRKKRMM